MCESMCCCERNFLVLLFLIMMVHGVVFCVQGSQNPKVNTQNVIFFVKGWEENNE